jgi:hypothetical protein
VITADGVRVITRFPANQLYVAAFSTGTGFRLDRDPGVNAGAGPRDGPAAGWVVGYPRLKGLM